MRARRLFAIAWKSVAVGAAATAAGYLGWVGLAWSRYGHAAPASGKAVDSLLDQYMPAYDVVERHAIAVSAPAAVTLAAAVDADLEHSRIVRAIFRTRAAVLGASDEQASLPRGLLAKTQALGWGVLATVPDREIVVGAVTQPWLSDVVFRALPPAEFAAFDEPGFVKIAWTLRAEPDGERGSIFRTETRVIATDPMARARLPLVLGKVLAWHCRYSSPDAGPSESRGRAPRASGSLIDTEEASVMATMKAVANLAPIPDGLSDEQVLLCPDIFSTGLSGAESGRIRVGDAVAIFAEGPIGLCATLGARLKGASLIVAINPMNARLEMARRFGANVLLNPTHTDVVADIKRLTGGRGVDVAIEALGREETFESALRSIRPGGILSSLGVYLGKLVAPYEAIFAGLADQKIVTTLCPGGKERMRRLMAMVENDRVDLTPLVTHAFALDDIAEAFDLFSSQRDGVLKVALYPDRTVAAAKRVATRQTAHV